MNDFRRSRLYKHRITSGLVAGLLCLGGCSDLQTRLSRPRTPDPRVRLGWQDAVSLTGRELQNYTCPSSYVLTCERGGAITYECRCALR
jgi:hypothetical protein